MSAMTTERAIEVLKRMSLLMKAIKVCNKHSSSTSKKIQEEHEALDKAIEVMGQNKECQHPYHLVHTTCMGEINTCLACGEEL